MGYADKFTAAQAAQKSGAVIDITGLSFTAAQAAQKRPSPKYKMPEVFTAAQAAQKVKGYTQDVRINVHCRTGSSEKV